MGSLWATVLGSAVGDSVGSAVSDAVGAEVGDGVGLRTHTSSTQHAPSNPSSPLAARLSKLHARVCLAAPPIRQPQLTAA